MEQTPLAAGTARLADGAASQSQTVTRSDRAGQLPAGTDAPRSVLRRTPGWVPALAVYLVLAVVSWWHVWAGGHPDSTMTAGLGDPSSFVWFLESAGLRPPARSQSVPGDP